MNAKPENYSCFVLLNFVAKNVSRETFLPKKRTKLGTCEIQNPEIETIVITCRRTINLLLAASENVSRETFRS